LVVVVVVVVSATVVCFLVSGSECGMMRMKMVEDKRGFLFWWCRASGFGLRASGEEENGFVGQNRS